MVTTQTVIPSTTFKRMLANFATQFDKDEAWQQACLKSWWGKLQGYTDQELTTIGTRYLADYATAPHLSDLLEIARLIERESGEQKAESVKACPHCKGAKWIEVSRLFGNEHGLLELTPPYAYPCTCSTMGAQGGPNQNPSKKWEVVMEDFQQDPRTVEVFTTAHSRPNAGCELFDVLPDGQVARRAGSIPGRGRNPPERWEQIKEGILKRRAGGGTKKK